MWSVGGYLFSYPVSSVFPVALSFIFSVFTGVPTRCEPLQHAIGLFQSLMYIIKFNCSNYVCFSLGTYVGVDTSTMRRDVPSAFQIDSRIKSVVNYIPRRISAWSSASTNNKYLHYRLNFSLMLQQWDYSGNSQC